MSAKLTGEEWRYVWRRKSLEKMLKAKVSARIPLPGLRPTFPPGEGMRTEMTERRNLRVYLVQMRVDGWGGVCYNVQRAIEECDSVLKGNLL